MQVDVRRFIILLLCLTLSGTASAQDRTLRQVGDVLQYALPFAAAVCAVEQDRTNDFLFAYGLHLAVVKGLKTGLGNARINQRPDGTGMGFPSGHSASAMFGATNLAQKCYPERSRLRALTYGSAALVGLSRLDANRHDVLQVGAGLALGYFFNGFSFDIGRDHFSIGYTMKF